jgi:hypothetical protein
MGDFKAGKSNEMEASSIARSLPTRYCDHCHLSTPKVNPRCIHCRCLLPATHLLTDPTASRMA